MAADLEVERAADVLEPGEVLVDSPVADLRIAWLRLDPTRGPRERVMQPTVWVTLGSAARVHGLGVFAGAGHTFASARRIQTGGLVAVHRRVGGVPRADWEVKDGFAVTTVARTAVDLLAARTDGGHVGRFLADALRVGAVSKDQLVHRLAVSHDDIELATLGWVHWWNTERIHGYLHDLSPDQFETAYAAANTDHTTTENQNIQPAQNPG